LTKNLFIYYHFVLYYTFAKDRILSWCIFKVHCNFFLSLITLANIISCIGFGFMVINVTFNNISVISWRISCIKKHLDVHSCNNGRRKYDDKQTYHTVMNSSNIQQRNRRNKDKIVTIATNMTPSFIWLRMDTIKWLG
jgi:hypothetical protein